MTFRTLTYTLHFLLATFTTRRCLRLVQRLTDKGRVRSLETIGSLERKLDDDVEASVVTRGALQKQRENLMVNSQQFASKYHQLRIVIQSCHLEEEEESGQWENSETQSRQSRRTLEQVRWTLTTSLVMARSKAKTEVKGKVKARAKTRKESTTDKHQTKSVTRVE